MSTARSSSCHGGSPHTPGAGTPLEQAPPQEQTPPGAGTPQSRPPGSKHPPGQIPLNFLLGCWPGPDPPQLPPWLWAWRPPPSQIPLNFPLGVDLETCKTCWDTTTLPPPDTWCKACWDTTLPPSMNRITDACENITLPQLRCGR